MTTSERNKAWKTWLCAGLLTALGGTACTREEADKSEDRVRESAHRAGGELKTALHEAKQEAKQIGDKLPPASEVRADLKHAGKETGDAIRDLGSSVKREAEEARDRIRENNDRRPDER